MKQTLSILTIFAFSNLAYTQISLSVDLRRKHSENDVTFIVDKLSIIKNDTLFKEILNPTSFAFFGIVRSGEYKFQYKNLFGEKIEKKIELNEANNILGGQEVVLFVDEIQVPIVKDLFISRLKNGEYMQLHFSFSGCFNSGKDSLVVSKKKDEYYIVHRNRKRRLKPSEVSAIESYEIELRSLGEVTFISTSNGFNKITYNTEKYEYIEPSFYWNGYDILLDRLKIYNRW